jgi:hypothetical protein
LAEFRQHSLWAALPNEQGEAAVREFLAQTIQALQQETHPGLARIHSRKNPRVEHKEGEPLFHALCQRGEGGIVLQAQIVPKPMYSAHARHSPPGLTGKSDFRTLDLLHIPGNRTEIQPQNLIPPYIYTTAPHRPTYSTRPFQPVESPKEIL